MKYRTILLRHLPFLLLFIAGLELWWLGTVTIGESYATAVGPDFLLKIPVALVKLAAILWISRWLLRNRFPTIDAFTRRGEKPESEFEKLWNAPLLDGRDWRLMMSVIAHLGALLITSLVVLFAL